MAAPKPSANGNWFYNKQTGQIQHITNFFEKMYFEARSDIYVSFDTQADALAYKQQYEAHKSNPSSPSPVKDWWLNPSDGTIFHGTEGEMGSPWIAFSSQAEAEAYLKAHPATDPLHQIGRAVQSAGSAASDLGGLVQALTQKATWLRIGEGALGLLLIGIGVAAMTRNTNAYKAAQSTALKAVKYIK